jgi:hypothetical protein
MLSRDVPAGRGGLEDRLARKPLRNLVFIAARLAVRKPEHLEYRLLEEATNAKEWRF